MSIKRVVLALLLLSVHFAICLHTLCTMDEWIAEEICPDEADD